MEEENKKKKKEKEPDIPPAGIIKIARESKPEWQYFLVGGFFSTVAGVYPVIMATCFAEVIGVGHFTTFSVTFITNTRS